VTNYIFHFNNAPHDPVISLYVHYIYIYMPLYPVISLCISLNLFLSHFESQTKRPHFGGIQTHIHWIFCWLHSGYLT
jgi:hypothetical protein